MDIKRTQQGYGPPLSTSLRSKSSNDASAIRSTDAASPGAARPSGSADGVQNLVELGRSQAMSDHAAMVERLRQEVQAGTYKPDWDVVASRIAEVL